MKVSNGLAAIALVMIITGCDIPPEKKGQYDQEAKASAVKLPVSASTDRVTVTRIQVVNDTLAYGDRRGVYIIKDNETGREYIGVSGVGITEKGSHSNGKSSTNDER